MSEHTYATAKFWRLLAEYERLTAEEGIALSAQNFEGAREAQARKPALLAGLAQLGQELQLSAAESPLRERVEALAAAERAHHSMLGRKLGQARTERRQLDLSRSRLRALEHSSYAGDGSTRRPFFAQG